jgi:p-hydroxybenzoate 3-monooxygenase
MEETQVGIVGAGPAGLVLSQLLAAVGIGSVVLEQRDRGYVESRVRAGVLEQGTVDLLSALGIGERMRREGLVHHGVNLQFDGSRHRIDFAALTGRAITVYGQQEVVKDLIAARIAAGGDIRFDVSDVAVLGIGGDRPTIRFHHEGRAGELRSDIVAGCDGFHGVCRRTIPSNALRIHEREYPFAWLGILAAVPPSTDELIYAYHERGFAMHSLRSPSISRLYLQVDPADDVRNWPDARIWEELQIRLACDGWSLTEGPILERSITPMRSFVAEPMRCGRLFLAGDAAHIVPPTGAKGMNLAIADVTVMADALARWYRTGATTGLDSYSRRCLERVWRVQDFSTTMTHLLHVDPIADDFGCRVQRARQAEVCRSTALATNLAENYVGLPLRADALEWAVPATLRCSATQAAI